MSYSAVDVGMSVVEKFVVFELIVRIPVFRVGCEFWVVCIALDEFIPNESIERIDEIVRYLLDESNLRLV